MTNEDYHGDKTHYSSSVLKYALHNMPKFKKHVDGKLSHEETQAMAYGTLVHTLVLEPHLFDLEYCVHEGETTATGLLPKKVVTAWEKKGDQRKLVPRCLVEKAKKAVEAIKAYPPANDLMFGSDDGENESSYFVKCSTSGLNLKFRPDRYLTKRKIIIDLKTASQADFDSFKRAIKWQFDYDLSAYQYTKGMYEVEGDVCEFYWVVVSSEDDPQVAVYKMSQETFQEGKTKFEKAVAKIEFAIEQDKYRLQNEVQEI
ncbi:PD-(D/E)XK nuclease-like domain-containing protein [Flavobacterium alkalisoli]|uniref:PD-(D/E)XK nuclease-like domain-containing protein n=1 Tax=Flavobacterium alkalisoli TaxID=2602769 RepID=UPI003A8F4A98